jgi:hypothetical protein
MEGYLGEFDVDIQQQIEFKDFTPTDWALYYISSYGGFDGAHHKDWVLDQVARILLGTKVIVKEARWENGQSEYRVSLDKKSPEYKQWVKDLCYGEDGPNTYDYNKGIAP